MATVTIPDAVYHRLNDRASALSLSVEQLLSRMLEQTISSNSQPLQGEEWKREFDQWMSDIESRKHRYPPGFVVDDSRDSIYGERINAQI